MLKGERKAVDFICRDIYAVVGGALVVLALLIRWNRRDFISGDVQSCLLVWYEKYKAAGGLAGLSINMESYYVPYMLFLSLITYIPKNPVYLIKVLSIVFEFATAFFAAMIVREIFKESKRCKLYAFIVFFFFIYSPIVVINGALWGQNDYIYMAFIFASVYFLIKEKSISSFVFLGLAFSVKMQTIFMLPVFILIYIVKRSFSALNFLIIPAVYFVCGLPAVFMGRPLAEVLSINFSQVDFFKILSMQCPNVYYFVDGNYDLYANAGILFAVAMIAAFSLLVIKNRKSLGIKDILYIAMWMPMTCVMFLPAMHERYSIIFVSFAALLYLFDRKKVWIALSLNAIAFFSYMPTLTNVLILDYKILSILQLVIYCFITLDAALHFLNAQSECAQKEPQRETVTV
ncbi:MAG: hypothetical protein RR058_01435 [Oscillospiraceae bacterium]